VRILQRGHDAEAQVSRAEASEEGEFFGMEEGARRARAARHAALPHHGARGLPGVQQGVRHGHQARGHAQEDAPAGARAHRDDGGAAGEALQHGRHPVQEEPRALQQALGVHALPPPPRRRPAPPQHGREYARSRHLRGAGPYPRWPGHRHRTCISRHSQHGRLRHLGRFLQDQAQGPTVQQPPRRLRPPQLRTRNS
jgi:hypothetical protein